MNAITRYTATERRLRRTLSGEGWQGATAKIIELELVAIERPGWVQFFVFEVMAERPEEPSDEGSNAEPERLTGVLRDDGRDGCSIQYAETASDREAIVAEWSTTAIRASRHATPETVARTTERIFLVLIAGLVLSLVLALFTTLVRRGDAGDRVPAADAEAVLPNPESDARG